MSAPKPAHPFREALFQMAVRNRLVKEVMAQDGLTRAEARELVDTLDADVIEQAAVHVAGDANPKVGAGGFLQFLLDFLASPAFAQLLAILLSLFGGPPVPGAAPPAAPPPA